MINRIDLKDIALESIDSDDFAKRVISVFKKNENKLEFFLFEHFDTKVRNALSEIYDDVDFKNNSHIQKIIPKRNRKVFLRNLEGKTNIVMPRPVMSWFTFIFSISLVLIPVIIILYFSLLSKEFFFVSLVILTSGGVFILFILLLIVHFLNPSLLSSNDLPRVKTYLDFITELVKINKHIYKINDFRLTRELLLLSYKVIQYDKLS